jgi:tetratricopeptide (TPR) repeat protein
MIAEQKYELSQKNNDRKLEEEARRFYDQSRELYSQFQVQPGVKLTDDQRAAIQQRVTRCYLQTGKFEEAVKVYEDITGRDPERKNGSAWEAKADCYMAQAKAMEKSQARVDLVKKADEIFGDLAARLQQLSIRNEHFWRLMYKHADALFEWNYEQLQAFFKVMDSRGYSPQWDENKWGFQVKFEDLRKKLQEKVGGNK